MNAGDSRQGYPVRSAMPWISREVGAPRWFLNLRLKWIDADIVRLEAQLGDEFALIDTAPLYREIAALMAVREVLERRLPSPD